MCRANRPAPELEAIIGYFINPVVLRTQLEGSLTFREAMHRVRDTVVGAQANAEVSFLSEDMASVSLYHIKPRVLWVGSLIKCASILGRS